jgi:hypothetical protein
MRDFRGAILPVHVMWMVLGRQHTAGCDSQGLYCVQPWPIYCSDRYGCAGGTSSPFYSIKRTLRPVYLHTDAHSQEMLFVRVFLGPGHSWRLAQRRVVSERRLTVVVEGGGKKRLSDLYFQYVVVPS